MSKQYVRRRTIAVRHRGNLANRMIEYMVALTLKRGIKGATLTGVDIPEMGIKLPPNDGDRYLREIYIPEHSAYSVNIQELIETANRHESIRITIDDYVQRMEFLLDRHYYDSVLPAPVRQRSFGDGELLINVRAGELLKGYHQYPLVPAEFYLDIVQRTGLRPIFVGQLEPSAYTDSIHARFPDAEFIPSAGARTDFDLVRSAKNIIVSVSTFSWLAAWLSEASQIFLPLNGLLNPAHVRRVDLVPVEDLRYRFFLFPLNFGVRENQALEHHARISGRWKEVSRSQVAHIKSAAPFLTPRAEKIRFDPVWYAHEYVDAAMEISEGWYEDPLHHTSTPGKFANISLIRARRPRRASPTAPTT